MKRLAIHFLTTLSALLCAFVVIVWVRSYFLGDFGEFLGSFESRMKGRSLVIRNVGVYSSQGCFGVGMTHSEYLPADDYFAHLKQIYPPDGPRLVWTSERCFERIPFDSQTSSAMTPSWWNQYGFCARNYKFGWATSWIHSPGVAVPHWLLAGSLALPPLAWCHRLWRRYRRRSAGSCVECGYDLRASLERCPECGALATLIPARA